MMKKRLLIAKRLLKETGILIITIDDNELSHLDCILMSMFPEYDRLLLLLNTVNAEDAAKTWLNQMSMDFFWLDMVWILFVKKLQ